ncbi:MAG: helix-turn-helix domain-containing protein [Pseudomonadota bacterium]
MTKERRPEVYDTAMVSPNDRFAFWREAVCESYVQLGCEAESKRDFDGRIDIARHTLLSISKVRGKAHAVERRKRDIGAATDAYFLLSLQTASKSRISQFGHSSLLEPGDMALYASTDPYTLQLDDGFSQVVVQVPSDSLLQRLPGAHLLTAQKVDGQSAIGRLVGTTIIAFSQHIDHDNPVVGSLIQDTLVDLIATGLASLDEVRADLSSSERNILIRAKSFIQNNIGNPDLDRTLVAETTGMSTRRLNEIFARADGSISQFIRSARLNAIKSDLRDRRFASLSITEIAFKNGFSNIQHFSQAFKQQTGLTPRDFRRLDDAKG